MSPALDDLIEVENDLRHLKTLIDVTTDMMIDATHSPGASPSDIASHNQHCHLMWISRDMIDRVLKGMEAGTSKLLKEQTDKPAMRMTGEVRS